MVDTSMIYDAGRGELQQDFSRCGPMCSVRASLSLEWQRTHVSYILIIIGIGKLARAFARFLRVFPSHFVPDPTQGK